MRDDKKMRELLTRSVELQRMHKDFIERTEEHIQLMQLNAESEMLDQVYALFDGDEDERMFLFERLDHSIPYEVEHDERPFEGSIRRMKALLELCREHGFDERFLVTIGDTIDVLEREKPRRSSPILNAIRDSLEVEGMLWFSRLIGLLTFVLIWAIIAAVIYLLTLA